MHNTMVTYALLIYKVDVKYKKCKTCNIKPTKTLKQVFKNHTQIFILLLHSTEGATHINYT